MEYTVYIIYRKDNLDVVYIGITKNKLSARFRQHFKKCSHNRKKVNYFNKYKNLLDIKPIETNIKNLKYANYREIYYIKKYRDLNYPLLNATDGGDGTLNKVSWNKGKKCLYKDKLISNSPKSKKVYAYFDNGYFYKEYNSIKSASKDLGVTRCAIANICNGILRYVTSKGYTFRFYKRNYIELNKVSNEERINRLKCAKLENCRKASVLIKETNEILKFDNYLEMSIYLNIKKSTIQTYLSLSKETKKHKYYYEQ